MLCIVSWITVLYLTGAEFDYQNDTGSGFIALRLAPQAGRDANGVKQDTVCGFGEGEITDDCGRNGLLLTNDPFTYGNRPIRK